MQVITTHIHADFDGLASMIAARKIYPDAILSFPGSQEKNLRNFTSQTLLYRYEFRKARSIDLDRITQLIIVDTRSSTRIGRFKACLDNPATEIHLYDHHPMSQGDIKAKHEVIKDTGSTTTLFTEIFQEKDIEITADEATIMALGIYEDTGSLTHQTTTPADLRAAAWLLERGAKLDVIAQFLTHDLTRLQIQLLNDLMANEKRYTIQNIPVVVATLSLEEYIDDFALIVKHYVAMENLDNLFALVSMTGRIYMIARSRIADINVGAIARDMGGGGHASAAAATIRNMTLVEAHDRLVRILHRHIHPQPVAKEMMSHPAITIPTNATIHHAHELLTRYNITTLVVTPSKADKERLATRAPVVSGIITRLTVEKAIHHSLGDLPVDEYMNSDIEILSPNATLSDIQELIIENNQRLIPILHDGEICGIITRTDLLNRLVNDPSYLPENQIHESDYPSLGRRRNLTSLMVEFLGPELISLLKTIGEVAEELSCAAFAVGGIVRDLLMKKTNLDLDIVVEDDGIKFARGIARVFKAKVVTHERFGTAMVLLPNGFKIDVATARLEYYEYPAAMPTVELSSIKLDLYRRDFSINAMAIQLNPEQFGNLIDFFNCQNDLKQRTIKVLHNLSFVEDPTRIFRAVRLEQRLGFTISKHTVRLIKNAVNMQLFGKKDDPRLFNELQHILMEENPLPALFRLSEFDLLQFLWPKLHREQKIDERMQEILDQSYQSITWFKLLYLEEKCDAWIVYLLAIMGRSGKKELADFCNRFKLPPKMKTRLLQNKECVEKTIHHLSTNQKMSNSSIYKLFSDMSNEEIITVMALAQTPHIKKTVSLFITTLKTIRPDTTGKDLKQMGYEAGPEFKKMLTRLKHEKLDGIIKNREDEIAFLQKHFPLP